MKVQNWKDEKKTLASLTSLIAHMQLLPLIRRKGTDRKLKEKKNRWSCTKYGNSNVTCLSIISQVITLCILWYQVFMVFRSFVQIPAPSVLTSNNWFYLRGSSVSAGQSHHTSDSNSHLIPPPLFLFPSSSFSSSSCCFSHQASGSSQVFDQCSVARRLVVLSSVRQRQRASRRGMKGNWAVQPLLFTMGNLLHEVVEQITTFSLPFLTSTETQCVSIFL